MPSIRASLFASLTIAATLFNSATALPRPAPPTNTLAQYQIPLSNGTSSLTAPSTSLKAIGLGRGTQNYTCAAPTKETKPVAIGAKAILFDAVPYLQSLPPAQKNKIISQLPNYVINFGNEQIRSYNPNVKVLGSHIFNAAGQPTFDLTATGQYLVGKKLENIAAPADKSSPGPNWQGNGAVDWLYLTDAGGSRGLGSVYRVETAGGKAPATCEGVTEPIYEEYATLYFFY